MTGDLRDHREQEPIGWGGPLFTLLAGLTATLAVIVTISHESASRAGVTSRTSATAPTSGVADRGAENTPVASATASLGSSRPGAVRYYYLVSGGADVSHVIGLINTANHHRREFGEPPLDVRVVVIASDDDLAAFEQELDEERRFRHEEELPGVRVIDTRTDDPDTRVSYPGP